jgi:uncharacterized protein YkwD
MSGGGRSRLAFRRRPLYCPRHHGVVRRARRTIDRTGVPSLLRSIKKLGAVARATTRSLGPPLSRHRAVTRIVVAMVSLAIAMAISFEGAAAGPSRPPARPASILPANVGVGLRTTEAVSLTFEKAMDPSSVESVLSVRPHAAIRTLWRADGKTLLVIPTTHWQTDARYVISVEATARATDGSELGAPTQVSFTTQTSPVIADFELRYADEPAEPVLRALTDSEVAMSGLAEEPAPPDTASRVSTGTSVTIGFSVAMDRLDVVRNLTLSPFVPGIVTWDGNSMIFTPVGRLEPSARYALSLAGAHDLQGNPLGGDASFSFTTRVGAQVVKVSPLDGAKNVVPKEISLWFSQPMDVQATTTALKVVDGTSGAAIAGKASWNDKGTQLHFAPARPLPKGHTIKLSLVTGALDSDRNAVAGSWTFRTKAAPPAPAPVVRRVATGPAAPANMVQFALWQINQSRAAYGFGPLSLDSAISSVASAHAWDMMNHGYFSHIGRDGSTVSIRLSRAGISFSASGENLCSVGGSTLRATLEWCHSTFMSEPYPGYANHKGNVLGTRYSRVGIGIAQSGGKIIIVWDFAG